jgi:hypothetical protein
MDAFEFHHMGTVNESLLPNYDRPFRSMGGRTLNHSNIHNRLLCYQIILVRSEGSPSGKLPVPIRRPIRAKQRRTKPSEPIVTGLRSLEWCLNNHTLEPIFGGDM